VKDNVGKLRAGIVVRVTELSHNDMVAWVETNWGLSRRMFCHHLDFGFEFRTKSGEWIPEHNPRALHFLLRVLAELAAGAKERHVGDYDRKLDAKTAEKILRRNSRGS
jgi:hypothetical protein